MEINKINELAKVLNENNLSRIEVTEGNLHIILESDNNKNNVNNTIASTSTNNNNVISSNNNITTTSQTSPISENIENNIDTNKEVSNNNDYIQKSPLVGTLYISNKPEDPALVSVGQRVSKGDPICIVESMKMFNPIEAHVDGVISEIYFENGQVVEFDQPIVAIKQEV